MKALLQLTMAIALAPLSLIAQVAVEESDTSKSESVYLFIGGELSAKQGKGHYPVLSMSKRHIVLDKGTTTKRISGNSQILMRLKPNLSYSMVEVSQFDFTFSSTIPAALEARAMSEMMRHDWGTDTQISIIPDAISQSRGRRNDYYEQVEELKRENRQYQEDLEDETRDLIFEAERISDTIHIELEFFPYLDYENAYVAVAVGRGDESENSVVGSNSQVVVGYLGTLRANTVEAFRLRMSLKPFHAENAVCELFLFCEEGIPIATNLSRGLKRFTREQIEALQNREE